MATAQGIQDIGLHSGKPVVFGVLTDDNIEQSRARSGGVLGNKGVDCAQALVEMLALQAKLKS
jgi:6,7-dimethyl-8-ribityllumazine synthase